MTIQEQAFYQRVFEALAQPPEQRYALLAQLHTDVHVGFVAAIRALSVADASRVSADGRSVAQVVGHIMEWASRFCKTDTLPLAQPQNFTGRQRSPRNTKLSRYSGASIASSSSGMRRSSVPMAICPSSRASGAPRQ